MLSEMLDRLSIMLGHPTLTFPMLVKFDSSQKCWVTVANNSIVFKC